MESNVNGNKEPLEQFLRKDLVKNLVMVAESGTLGELNTSYEEGPYKVSIYLEKTDKKNDVERDREDLLENILSFTNMYNMTENRAAFIEYGYSVVIFIEKIQLKEEEEEE